MDIEQVARDIGVPVERWAGNCHGISEYIVDKGVLRSLAGPDVMYRVARGHWRGPIRKGSHFEHARDMPFVPHSWIQSHGLVVLPDAVMPLIRPHLRNPESTISVIRDPIIDPTRFAFDGKAPYIYIGESDYYDEGGNTWRQMVEPTLLPFDDSRPPIHLNLPAVTEAWIRQQLQQYEAGRTYPYGYYTYALVMWLANLSLHRLGEHARPIFAAIVEAGQAAAIPIDNRRLVLG